MKKNTFRKGEVILDEISDLKILQRAVFYEGTHIVGDVFPNLTIPYKVGLLIQEYCRKRIEELEDEFGAL